MALSQQYPGLMVVPWFNRQEWEHVHSLIQDNTNKEALKQANNILEMWKTRTPNLPCGIEGSLMLIKAFLLDENAMGKFELTSTYGVILLRFLNLCCASGSKQGTFTESVKSLNIPEWIVNTRHDIAHKHTLPKDPKLKLALEFCYNWILKNYWADQEDTLNNHYSFSYTISKNLPMVFELYCELNCLHYKKNGCFTLKDLKMTGSLKEKFHNVFQLTNMKPLNIVRGVLEQLVQFIKDHKAAASLDELKSILSSTIMSFDGFLSVRDEDCDELPEDYIAKWNDFIDLLFELDLLEHFLSELLDVVNYSLYDPAVRKVASLWMLYVLQRLLLTQLCKDNLQPPQETDYFQLYPALKKITPIPNCNKDDTLFENIKKLRMPTINNPNVYTLTFLRCLLRVCKYPETSITKAVDLVNMFCNPTSSALPVKVPVTTLPVSVDCTTLEHVAKKEVKDEPTNDNQHMETDDVPSTRFQLVTDYSIFKGCPLGLLTYQNPNKNPWEDGDFQL